MVDSDDRIWPIDEIAEQPLRTGSVRREAVRHLPFV